MLDGIVCLLERQNKNPDADVEDIVREWFGSVSSLSLESNDDDSISMRNPQGEVTLGLGKGKFTNRVFLSKENLENLHASKKAGEFSSDFGFIPIRTALKHDYVEDMKRLDSFLSIGTDKVNVNTELWTNSRIAGEEKKRTEQGEGTSILRYRLRY